MTDRLVCATAAALLFGCAAPLEVEDKERSIVNGEPTSEYPSTGAILVGETLETARLRCSGTLIGCDTFLTAAHCVCDGVGADCLDSTPAEPLKVFFPNAGVYDVVSQSVHTEFDFPTADVAVLHLERPVEGITPTPLMESPPAMDAQGTIVGYGRTGGDSYLYGIKRVGSIVTGACPDLYDPNRMVCWGYAGEPNASTTCHGDSGGPLFFTGADGVTRIGGITNGFTGQSCLDAAFLDASVAHHQHFIRASAVGALGGDACGELPPVGDGAVTIDTESQDLVADDFVEMPIEAPEGTTQIRITANADHPISFQVTDPERNPMPCGSATETHFAECVIDAPAFGTYSARARSTAGGTAQLHITVIGSGPTANDDAYETLPGGALEVEAAAGVLANDSAPRGPLKAELVAEPMYGTVELDPNGSIRYQADAGYEGPDAFSYLASDGSYETLQKTVSLDVLPQPTTGLSGGCSVSQRSSGAGGWAGLALLALALVTFRGSARPRWRRSRPARAGRPDRASGSSPR